MPGPAVRAARDRDEPRDDGDEDTECDHDRVLSGTCSNFPVPAVRGTGSEVTPDNRRSSQSVRERTGSESE
ncbi:hypothetical protein DIQ79_07125 [Mycolicibacterium smegmatis]|uniref:Uncharacterized protein n=1 Tax=Mycolicibacterium smegmatis (strain ATCC 700084 / mc(2)155) TaxID=246196 RepID=A0QZ18_MYCS2|nr:hypothetical protein MSMEG_3865 [Mycolicibacterium smegmatis MC2 155]TBM51967.1 hypothetical protein DIQ86_04075 [Mycolicibacterium smegmatis]TBH50419.1 hypothetical protein EYS45_05605 [Mycolicibacterium smegmatis MC2 155]TBM53790.1 hypothetical protein DIQ85_07070 [Mycolicibacterium smegmatis]TBM65335.1 hypothetical protein DIQ83_07125 [Mycolicibacterium smegmatis]